MTARRCFYIPEGQCHPDRGYIPSIVTEGEPGHSPLIGNGEYAEPWYWGDLEQATRIAIEANAKLGLTEQDAKEIVASSIGASIKADAQKTKADDRFYKAMARRRPTE